MTTDRILSDEETKMFLLLVAQNGKLSAPQLPDKTQWAMFRNYLESHAGSKLRVEIVKTSYFDHKQR